MCECVCEVALLLSFARGSGSTAQASRNSGFPWKHCVCVSGGWGRCEAGLSAWLLFGGEGG